MKKGESLRKKYGKPTKIFFIFSLPQKSSIIPKAPDTEKH